MSKGVHIENTANADALSPDEITAMRKQYEEIKYYEHHFNNLQTEIRKLASIWLIAAFGAIAYLVRGAYLGDTGAEVSKVMISPHILIAVVSAMGIFGLLILWILDQVVYHGLLSAAFLFGLRMEFRYRFLPPIRTLMMLFSRKKGMSRYMRLFYAAPMVLLGVVACGALYLRDNHRATELVIAVGALLLLIPLFIYVKGRNMEKYTEIAEGFGDKGFLECLKGCDYEAMLKGR